MTFDSKMRQLTRGLPAAEIERLVVLWLSNMSVDDRNRINAKVQILDRRGQMVKLEPGGEEEISVSEASNDVIKGYCAMSIIKGNAYPAATTWAFLRKPLQACLEEAARRGLVEGVLPEEYDV